MKVRDSADQSRGRKSSLFEYQRAVRDSSMASTTKHVLLTLSTYMQVHTRDAFPFQQRLARDTGYSERTVRRHLEAATKSGYLVKGRRFPGRKYRGVIPSTSADETNGSFSGHRSAYRNSVDSSSSVPPRPSP